MRKLRIRIPMIVKQASVYKNRFETSILTEVGPRVVVWAFCTRLVTFERFLVLSIWDTESLL